MGKAKTNITRGMRDVLTIQGMRNRVLPKNREQAATELARMEHEKARLEREMAMWVSNQRRTEVRLQHVNERLAMLEAMFNPPGSKAAAVSRRAAGDEEEDEPQGWHQVSIQY
jgi:hypothetical protein